MKQHWKRVLSLVLAAALTLALGVTAFAESESLDSQLAQVTQQVKQTLDLNTDAYTEFYGDRYDQPGGPVWNLNWYADNANLSINVTNGVITSYYCYENRGNDGFFYGFNPAYPANSKQQAQAAAQAFLDKVLDENETADFTYARASLGGTPSYYFNGTVRKNGLDTPITFHISVGGSDLTVTNFSRSNEYNNYLSTQLDRPGAAKIDAAGAQDLLRTTVDFELIWVLGEGGEARLQYVPKVGSFVVDAVSGELVDMDALYAEVASGGYNYSMATAAAAEPEEAAMDAAGRLTEVEQTAIANLEDVLPVTQLDAALRAVQALGLSQDFSMTSNYQTNQKTGEVTCTLRYSSLMDQDHTYGYDPAELEQYQSWGGVAYYNKTIQVNARTGEIKSVNAWAYVGNYAQEGRLEDEAVLAAAADFLKTCGTDAAKAMEVYEAQDNGFQFAQTEAGYFFPGNSVYVGVNPVTGTIERLSYTTPETQVTFGPATGLIAPEAALEAYLAASETALRYVAWPVAITPEDPILYAYADYGYSFVERLALVYTLDFGRSTVQGIDAVTGQVNAQRFDEETTLGYTDLEGHYGKDAIEALALVGIGYSEEQFRPTDFITQRELAQLLLGAAYGNVVDGFDEDSLKREAAYYGFISAEAWDPEAQVTRMDVLKAILNASEYGKAAALSGAYYCSFNDESGVQPQDYGYVSIGQALGVVHGTPEGYFNAYGLCTRQDAAIMVYNFLCR